MSFSKLSFGQSLILTRFVQLAIQKEYLNCHAEFAFVSRLGNEKERRKKGQLIMRAVLLNLQRRLHNQQHCYFYDYYSLVSLQKRRLLHANYFSKASFYVLPPALIVLCFQKQLELRRLREKNKSCTLIGQLVGWAFVFISCTQAGMI